VAPDDDNESVIYEVNLDAEAGIEGPFDTWLRDHVADVLQFDGFLSAEILSDPTAPAGRIRRIVQYRLRDQAALDAYLRDHAPRMRAQGVEKFGERFRAERRVLAHREEFVRGAFSTENCLNCGEVLRGQHCSHCGQRARVRVLSLGALLRDLFGDLTNFDSRLWRTLRPLAFRPGALTVEFLRGRRTHYSPPFRMYLILSVVFFLLSTAGGNPGDALRFDVNPDGEGGANVDLGPAGEQPPAPAAGSAAGAAAPAPGDGVAPTGPAAAKLDPERQRIVDAILKRVPESERSAARRDLEREFAGMTPEQVAPVSRLMNDPCGEDTLKLDIGPLGDQYAPRLREACRKIASDGRGFGRAVYENIPKMMFIFLPLIAAVMFVLYLGSGRYYVEHLLFFVHFHAFFFLGGTAVLLLELLSAWSPWAGVAKALESAGGALAAVLMLYVPYYLYRAMRRVYEQGRFVTLVKYSLLVVGYMIFLTLTVVGLVIYTALTL
jgi:Protein of unknown function (DUF3667)/Domain of unknown function (DUF4286)